MVRLRRLSAIIPRYPSRRPPADVTNTVGAKSSFGGLNVPLHESRKSDITSATNRHFRNFIAILTFLAVAGVSWSLLNWIYRRHHYFFGCPEKSLFIRRPTFSRSRSTPKLLYLTGKFGTPENTVIPNEVSTHIASMMRLGPFRADEVQAYSHFPSFLLNDSTWDRHLQFYVSGRGPRRGGGFWFWKPAIIDFHLSDLKDGDFLIYADPDRVDFLSWLPLLLETMQERDSNLALEQMPYKEKQWTKGDIYSYFNVSEIPDEDETFQYNGSLIVVRKNAATVQFIKDWLTAASDYHLLSDERSIARNAEGFEENRHDQSLLSMLLKQKYLEEGKKRAGWDCLTVWKTFTFQLK